jgi:hypothetical protein
MEKNMTTHEDVVWLAGLLEGEGWFRKRGTPMIGISMIDRDVIERAHKIMGSRAVHKRERPNKSHRAQYTAAVYGDQALAVMKDILPYMGKRRSTQIKRIIAWALQRPGDAGKGSKGSMHPRSKLREEYIPFIRELYSRGISQGEIAEICHVARATINNVCLGRTWSHV